MFNRRLLPVFGLLLVIAILGLFVYLIDRSQVKTVGKTQIAATILPIYDIAQNIAGDKIQVVNILPAGASEHTFEPAVDDQRKILNSQLVLAIGLGLDNWATKIAASNNIKVVELHDGINLLGSTAEEMSNDPHYWLSIKNAKQIAANIATELITIDPSNRDYYEHNLQVYQGKLEQTFQQAQQVLQGIKTNKIITFHGAFFYFARELNLDVVATIEPFPGKEPSRAYLQEVEKIISANNVKTLFKEPQLSDSVVSALAHDYQANVQTLDPMGGTAGRNSYIDTYLYNVNTIANALK